MENKDKEPFHEKVLTWTGMFILASGAAVIMAGFLFVGSLL